MKLKTNKTFIKELITKIRNKKNKNWRRDINNYENNFEILNVERNVSRGGERKDGKKTSLVTIHPAVAAMRHPTKKKTPQWFQQHYKRVFLTTRRCNTCRQKAVGASYMLYARADHFFYFNNILRLLKDQIIIDRLDKNNNNKKKSWKDKKISSCKH